MWELNAHNTKSKITYVRTLELVKFQVKHCSFWYKAASEDNPEANFLPSGV